MKHQIFFTVVIVILLYNSSSLALDQMGPPVATLSKGDLHLGIDYSYSDLDFDVSGPVSGAPLYDKALGDAEIHKAFFHFGYGVTDNLELILRVGGAQMEVNGDEEDIVGFNFFDDDSGLNFAFGVGIKLTFYETEKLKCGALYSFSYIDFDDFPELNVVVQGTPLSFTPEIRLTENQIALGIDYHLMENL